MQIKPTDKTLKNLLESSFFKIPRFQRAYSWDKENVDDFWTDAITSDQADYFIGSFVVYPESKGSDTFMVVDGQQRLTTATLLLAAIRNAFDALGQVDNAKGVQKLVEREDINNQRRFILLTETSYPYLQEHIQKYGKAELPKTAGREEQALEAAFVYLTHQVNSVVQSVETDASINAKKKTEEKRARLLKLRDNVLRLQLIMVELTDEDEAYLIFETLNTRGKDLGIADLVKNLITKLSKPSNRDVDTAKEKWNKILSYFDESAVGTDINSFIHHSWLSRHPYTGKERLFRDIRMNVTKANVAQFLEELVCDAEIYRAIFEPNTVKWKKEEADIRTSLAALNIFRVVQPVPMTLALLRAYRDGPLSLKKIRAILMQLENFHVQFTALTAQRTGGGTAKMYAAAAEQLSKSTNAQSAANTLTDFQAKMQARKPSFAEFEAGFKELAFSTENTKQKALVQYILRRLDQHQRGSTPIDYGLMTIEHIAPENPPSGTARTKRLAQIGNLLLLDEVGNGKVANKDFPAKKLIYQSYGVPVDKAISTATSWGDKEIEARTTDLAKTAYNKVFKV